MSDFNQNTAGPQFELTETGGWGQRIREWLSNYGSSVILPIVALAILASGIYLYATQKRQQTSILEESPVTVVEGETEAVTDNEIVENLTVEPAAPTVETAAPAVEILPEKRTDSGTIVVTAGKGEGITHLARKALKAHLGESSDLTKEHKIYIEDYIKDKIGSKTLEVGEEIEISENLINEAINSARTLTPEQLKAIEQFSALVQSEI